MILFLSPYLLRYKLLPTKDNMLIIKKAGFAVGLFTLAIIGQQMLRYIPRSEVILPSLTRLTRYTKLETLLKAQNFKEADQETGRLVLALANRQREGWLRLEDAEKFPCKELRTIDNLWLKYSQGKFGISVQQEIYKNLGGTKEWDDKVWKSFADRVGWRQSESWLSYNKFDFSLSAPTGHLPLGIGWDIGSLKGFFLLRGVSLLSKHVKFNL